MDLQPYMPDARAVEQIRRDLGVYEPERVKALAQTRWRVPVFVGAYLPVAVALVVVAFIVAPEKHRLVVTALIGAGALFVGHWVHVLARAPTTNTQQWLRDRVLPIAFGFIDDVQYRHGVVPSSFPHLPKEVTGATDRREFDDVILGRHGDAWFEVFECHLTIGSGKSRQTVFRGVVLAFKIETPFAGKLVATRKIDGVSRWMRDLFGKGGLVEIESGDVGLDHAYEFRTDNAEAAGELFRANLGQALAWVRETWPGEPARVALSGDDGFLLLPTTKNFFELPDISVTLDYDAHIGPLAAQMASLVASAALVRQACVPVPRSPATDQPPPMR